MALIFADAWIPILIIGLIAGAVIGIIVLAAQYEKKRTERLRQAATEMGFQFLSDARSLPDGVMGSFELFSQGRSRRTSNLMQAGADDLRMSIFDYQYTTGSGKHSHTHRQTVICFQSPQYNLPAFALRPEHIFHKIGGLFGYHDIDFESHPRFSSLYFLRGSDEEAIRRVFRDDVMNYFEQNEGICVEANASQLIVYRAAQRVAPEKLRELLEQGFAIQSHLRGVPA